MSGWLSAPLDIPVALDREEANRRAVAELAKAKYGGRPGWFDDVTDRVFGFLEGLYAFYLRLVGAQQTPGSGVNWGFLIAVVVLVLALALVIWKVGMPKWRAGRRPTSLELDPTRPAADYRTLAKEHAARQDWRSAVRDRFRAVVRELEVRTILDVRPARTAWEAAYSAAAVIPECRDDLFAGADLFNRVLYGDQHCDEASYAKMIMIDQSVTLAVDRVDFTADVRAVARR